MMFTISDNLSALLNQFVPNTPFLYSLYSTFNTPFPLKTSGALGMNGLNSIKKQKLMINGFYFLVVSSLHKKRLDLGTSP